MKSKTKKLQETRDNIIETVCAYLAVARGIDDLEEEDDFEDFQSSIDSILESLLFDNK